MSPRFRVAHFIALVLGCASTTYAYSFAIYAEPFVDLVGPVKSVKVTMLTTQLNDPDVIKHEGSVTFNNQGLPTVIEEGRVEGKFANPGYDRSIFEYRGGCLSRYENWLVDIADASQKDILEEYVYPASPCVTYNAEYFRKAHLEDLITSLGSRGSLSITWKGHIYDSVAEHISCDFPQKTCRYEKTTVYSAGVLGSTKSTTVTTIVLNDKLKIEKMTERFDGGYEEATYNAQGWVVLKKGESTDRRGSHSEWAKFSYPIIDAKGNWTRRIEESFNSANGRYHTQQVDRTIQYQ